jgi:LuxR family maltose regulon positive regulatory protein
MLPGQIAAVRWSIATERADAHGAIEYARQALSHLPQTEAFMRSLAAFNLGDAYFLTGEVIEASTAFSDAVDLSIASGSLHMVTMSSANLARTLILRGRLHEADQCCERALKVAADLSESPAKVKPTLGILYAYLGHLRRERDDLVAAEGHLDQALELGQQSGYVEVLAATYWALAQFHRAQADVHAGLAILERAIETVADPSLTAMRRLLLAERAELMVVLDRLEDAERWAREHRVGEVVEFGFPQERECLSLVRLRLARGEISEATDLLARLLSAAKAAGRYGSVIEILALQALALQEGGRHTAALSALEQALALAEPEGYVRTFADQGPPMAALLREVGASGIAPLYVARLLLAIASPGQASPEPISGRKSASDREFGMLSSRAGLLTDREVEVLRLLAGGASNQGIATALTVSVGTVKAHISHILGKIGAHNRTEAVVRARARGLLQ